MRMTVHTYYSPKRKIVCHISLEYHCHINKVQLKINVTHDCWVLTRLY